MAIELKWIASVYDLRPGDVFRPELDEDYCCFEVLDYKLTPERCTIRARKLNTSVEQDFTWNSPSFEVILVNRPQARPARIPPGRLHRLRSASGSSGRGAGGPVQSRLRFRVLQHQPFAP